MWPWSQIVSKWKNLRDWREASITENTSVYRVERRQAWSKRTEGVCEREQKHREPGVLEIRKERSWRRQEESAKRSNENSCMMPGKQIRNTRSVWPPKPEHLAGTFSQLQQPCFRLLFCLPGPNPVLWELINTCAPLYTKMCATRRLCAVSIRTIV